jgi:hypothetical protein
MHPNAEVTDGEGKKIRVEDLLARPQVSGRAMRDLLAARQREGSTAKARGIEARPLGCRPGR